MKFSHLPVGTDKHMAPHLGLQGGTIPSVLNFYEDVVIYSRRELGNEIDILKGHLWSITQFLKTKGLLACAGGLLCGRSQCLHVLGRPRQG